MTVSWTCLSIISRAENAQPRCLSPQYGGPLQQDVSLAGTSNHLVALHWTQPRTAFITSSHYKDFHAHQMDAFPLAFSPDCSPQNWDTITRTLVPTFSVLSPGS